MARKMDPGEFLPGEPTREVIGAAFAVRRALGYGFLERVYERALAEELTRRGLRAETQVGLKVRYKGVGVGHYVADLVVEGKVIVEIKAGKEYSTHHEARRLNYLKATSVRVGLLLNFGEKGCKFKRLAR